MTVLLHCIAFLHCWLCGEEPSNSTDWPIHGCSGPFTVLQEVGMETKAGKRLHITGYAGQEGRECLADKRVTL